MKPELLTLADPPEYYKPIPPGKKLTFREELRDLKQLNKDAADAHDNLRKLVVEKDQIRRLALDLSEVVKKQERKIAWLLAAVIAAWTPLWVPLLLHWAGK